MAQRLYVMHELQSSKPKILVTHISSLMRFMPNPELFISLSFNLKVGMKADLMQLRTKLVRGGYARVGKIDQSMQFASRGDILDIFSVNYLRPIRIEFFGDEIESIRYFDIATQSSDERIDDVTITPANDVLFTILGACCIIPSSAAIVDTPILFIPPAILPAINPVLTAKFTLFCVSQFVNASLDQAQVGYFPSANASSSFVDIPL